MPFAAVKYRPVGPTHAIVRQIYRIICYFRGNFTALQPWDSQHPVNTPLLLSPIPVLGFLGSGFSQLKFLINMCPRHSSVFFLGSMVGVFLDYGHACSLLGRWIFEGSFGQSSPGTLWNGTRRDNFPPGQDPSHLTFSMSACWL